MLDTQFPISSVFRDDTVRVGGQLADYQPVVFSIRELNREGMFSESDYYTFTNTLGKGCYFYFNACITVSVLATIGTQLFGYTKNGTTHTDMEVRNTSTTSNLEGISGSHLIFLENGEYFNIYYGTNNATRNIFRAQFSCNALIPQIERTSNALISEYNQYKDFDKFAFFEYGGYNTSIGTAIYSGYPNIFFDKYSLVQKLTNRITNPFGKTAYFLIFIHIILDPYGSTESTQLKLRWNNSSYVNVDSVDNLSSSANVAISAQMVRKFEPTDFFQVAITSTKITAINHFQVAMFYLTTP